MDPADSLDTAILTAGTRGWSGVQNRQKPGLLDAAALAVLINGRLDDTGNVQLRPGTEWLCQPAAAQPRGLFYYDVDTAEAILACVDGKVYEIPASTAPVQPIQIANAILATSGRCQGAQLVDKFAIADGLRLLSLWRESGAWQTMQVATFTGGQALPAVRGVVAHNFRLIIWGGTGATAETLYPSAVLEPWKFGAAEGIRVGRGEGDPIVVVLPGPHQTLFVGKGGSWWQVDLTGTATEWVSEAITHRRGCWAADTAVAVNQDVIFLARDGVANLAKLANDAPISSVDLISAPIEATIKRINWSAARRTACATMWGPYYLLAVPLDGAQRNNAVLAYNTTTQQWSGEWTGWAPEAWCQSKFDGQLATILADRAGHIARLDDQITTDGTGDDTTATIPLELETAAYSFEAPDLLKIPVALACEWRSGAATVDVSLRSDGGSPQTIEEDYDAAPEAGTINRPLIANLRELTGGRELQIRMVTTGGAFGLRELNIKAMPLRARWEAPPAELLVAPVPADDVVGTPTTLIGVDGRTITVALQEIDTITLSQDPLEFVRFRDGFPIPAGSYVIAYRDAAFSQCALLGADDVETETDGWIVTITGGYGWTGTAATWLPQETSGADDVDSYPAGTIADLSGGYGWTGTAAIGPEFEYPTGCDDSEAYPTANISQLNAGSGWSAASIYFLA